MDTAPIDRENPPTDELRWRSLLRQEGSPDAWDRLPFDTARRLPGPANDDVPATRRGVLG